MQPLTLVGHLTKKESPVNQFLHLRFPNTRAFLETPRKRVRAVHAENNALLPRIHERYQYSPLGTAIDFRIHCYFEEPEEEIDTLLRVLASRGSDADEFADYYVQRVKKIAVPGNRLEKQEEDDLNRFIIGWRHLSWYKNPTSAMGALYGTQDYLLDDMRAMSWTFFDKCSHLLTRPFKVSPRFEGSLDVGGAQGDLLIDGTLVEIKATIKAEVELRCLWQLLAYAMLDYWDQHGINAIALYMPRQGLYLNWDLEEALGVLCGPNPPSIMELRLDFNEMLVDEWERGNPSLVPWSVGEDGESWGTSLPSESARSSTIVRAPVDSEIRMEKKRPDKRSTKKRTRWKAK
ncbi:MAG: hypothetical protein OXC99_10035 [Chloroflexi bacterium]|nr:hypothetical protein [Chloroflexota bacterium]